MLTSEVKVYPIYVTNLANVLAVVVGGGSVGERKISGLLAAAARVRLISPQATDQLRAWAEVGKIEWLARDYQVGDLSEAFLVFATTNVRTINAQIAQEAATIGVLCNVADAPAEGNFHVPAVHRQANLVVAVGSSGQSPIQSKAVRDRLAAWLAANPPDDIRDCAR
jgi:cobalt-precorrin 5A hydrolase/precorrin-3B C17-methyltransferase